MQNQIYPQVWLHLSKAVKNKLVEIFNIKATGPTEIRDQELISDGFTLDDLREITLEKMCEYIGSVETFHRAWEITLAKVHSELNPPVGEIRKTIEVEVEKVIPWCDTCDSRGVRHKKTCPKYVPIEK